MTRSKWEREDPDYPCPECGNTWWLAIPDSLASACTNCTYVRVGGGNGNYKKGVSLKDWAKDLYESSQKKEKEDGGTGEQDS